MNFSKVSSFLWWVAVIGGAAAQGYALYVVQNPTLRLRIGLLAMVVVSIAIATAPRVEKKRAPVLRRRFMLLRNRVDRFLGEVSRLNWLVIDARRDPRVAATHTTAIQRSRHKLYRLVDGIIDAAGHVDADAESDEPFKPRFLTMEEGKAAPAPEGRDADSDLAPHAA